MSSKLQDLASTTSVTGTDILYTVVDPAGTPLDKKITVANMKTSLGLTGTNSGDQTSIVGITGTLSEFNTALSGADFATGGGTITGTSSGTNTGDQTSIVGITGTKAQFDTAVTDGNILYVGDVTQYTDEMAQDAVGGMVDSTLTYVDATPQLKINLGNANTWTADQSVPDEAYDATNWNGSMEVPTKNAIRDKIESMGGGASTPTFQWTTDFPITTRFNKQQSGGSNTFNSDGLSVSSGGSANGWAITRFDLGAGWGSGTAILGGTQVMSTRFYVGAGSDFCMAFGIGEMINDIAGGTNTMTSKHIGFKITRTGSGTINLYATQADGTTETVSSSLTTLSGGEEMELILQINGSSSVDYYWRKNGGALSSATNLTTNIPATGERWVCWGVNNNAVASSTTMYAFNGAYSR